MSRSYACCVIGPSYLKKLEGPLKADVHVPGTTAVQSRSARDGQAKTKAGHEPRLKLMSLATKAKTGHADKCKLKTQARPCC